MTGWSSLLDKWFHTFCSEGRVQQQGQIIGALGDGFYVVRFFEWFGGGETRRQLVHLSDIQVGRWALYETDAQMREHYDGAIGVLPHRGTCACTADRETVE